MGLKDRIQNDAKRAASNAAAKVQAERDAAEKAKGPEFPGDMVDCAVLGRKSRSEPWDYEKHFITTTLKQSVAFRSACYTEEQMRGFPDSRNFECLVLLYSDMLSGNFKRRLTPPKGFDFKVLKLAPKPAPAPVPAPVLEATALTMSSAPVRKSPPVFPSSVEAVFCVPLVKGAAENLKAMVSALPGKPIKKSVLV